MKKGTALCPEKMQITGEDYFPFDTGLPNGIIREGHKLRL